MTTAGDDITKKKNWTIRNASFEVVALDIKRSSMWTPETHVNTRRKSTW